MTAVFAEHVLVGDVIETRCSKGQRDADVMVVDEILLTPYGIMFYGQETWSETTAFTCPVPATSLVEVWSA